MVPLGSGRDPAPMRVTIHRANHWRGGGIPAEEIVQKIRAAEPRVSIP